MSTRIGLGIDYHQFITDRPLILGGVHIPYSMGLKGHSDADVVLHAISDAMLGALSLGDIGHYFPDTDSRWKSMNSTHILEKAMNLIKANKHQVLNIDVMLIIESPKMAPYIAAMRSCISQVLCLNYAQVSIKATTAEKMGFIGKKEGAAAHAVVLLEKIT